MAGMSQEDAMSGDKLLWIVVHRDIYGNCGPVKGGIGITEEQADAILERFAAGRPHHQEYHKFSYYQGGLAALMIRERIQA